MNFEIGEIVQIIEPKSGIALLRYGYAEPRIVWRFGRRCIVRVLVRKPIPDCTARIIAIDEERRTVRVDIDGGATETRYEFVKKIGCAAV